MIIIGVVGHPASGKDTVSEYLAKKGFTHVSSGEVIRDDLRKLGLPTDRETIHTFVLKKRAEEGNSYPTKGIVEAIKAGTGIFTNPEIKERVVVSGFRNTEEVSLFKKEFGDVFKLIAVNAPIENRYQWAKARGRIGDDVTFETFKNEDERERAISSGSFKVDGAMEMADILLINNSTKEDLYKKADDYLASIR